jgi:hypothetical protein
MKRSPPSVPTCAGASTQHPCGRRREAWSRSSRRSITALPSALASMPQCAARASRCSNRCARVYDATSAVTRRTALRPGTAARQRQPIHQRALPVRDGLPRSGSQPSPAFVRSREGNGCIERFFRALKEQLLSVRPYRNAEELRLPPLEWIERYNERWLVEHHRHRSPAVVRRKHLALKASAWLLSIHVEQDRGKTAPLRSSSAPAAPSPPEDRNARQLATHEC